MQPNRAKINAGLKKLGLGGLEDHNLFSQMAAIIRTHDQFRKLLSTVEPDKRKICYESLRSKLWFTPKPLDVYLSEAAGIAERRQLPTYYGPDDIREHKVPEISLDALATNAIRDRQIVEGKSLRLKCAKCATEEAFPATNRKDAERNAHKAGWRSNDKSSWCSKCVPTRLSMTINCADCHVTQKIRAWDPQDGYAHARLLGWLIDDKARCASCALKLVTVQ